LGSSTAVPIGAGKFALEGLSLAVANEVEQFGIKITVVEPGFFRTDLLDPQNVRWGKNTIEDYEAGRQPGRYGRLTTASNRVTRKAGRALPSAS